MIRLLAFLSLVAVITSGCAVQAYHTPGHYHYRPYVAPAPVYRYHTPRYVAPRYYRGY
jgi:hypothetical protein